MEKSGADIKARSSAEHANPRWALSQVQKSDEMAAGSKERLIKIIGTKDTAKEQRGLVSLLMSLGRPLRPQDQQDEVGSLLLFSALTCGLVRFRQ